MCAQTFVVGTAGHVDHGKSSLVRALTGTDPDRLAEEQARQMTIDLGFAEFTTPAGNRVHLVDVPGHERFVRNMLAGAGGIDAAILTIAADDGPMPQTREHLAILDLLGIEHGVVALSKVDLVDPEWLALVSGSIEELLEGTGFAGAEVVPVSPVTGLGLDELQYALDRALMRLDRKAPSGAARLPIDRVFTRPGFGTVVTGTLLSGAMRIGERVSIQPRGNEARIRGLQTFGEPVETAHPGSRVAINLSGIETDQLARGDVVVVPGSVQPAMRVDARVRILESSGRPLAHNDEVMVFAGSAETPARVALLAGEEIEAGQQGWVQLRMCAPVVVLPQDRFILRRPSPPETIGGGIVLVLDPSRHKRGDAVVLDRLELLTNGDPADRFWEWLGTRMVSKRELEQAPAGRELAEAFLAAGQAAGTVETLEMQGARVYVTQVALQAALDRVVSELSTYHVSHPLEAGAPREKIRQELGYERAIFDLLIARAVQDGIIEEIGPLMRHSGFQIRLSDSQRQRVDDFLRRVESASFQPPLPADAGLEPELVAAMIATGQVISVGDGIVFLPKQIELARGRLQSALGDHESISLAEFRDLLGTSRRYSQALLEYFDRQRLTRRVGDRRVGYRPAQDGEEQTER